jgi:hypothetical protein
MSERHSLVTNALTVPFGRGFERARGLADKAAGALRELLAQPRITSEELRALMTAVRTATRIVEERALTPRTEPYHAPDKQRPLPIGSRFD